MEENKITCVKCGHTFGVGEVLNNQLEQEKQKFRLAFDSRIAQLEEKHRKDTEETVAQKLAEERKNLDGILREQIQKDFQQRLSLLNAELETKRKETSDMQKIVFENEKLKHDMQQQRLQIEMEVQRKKNEEMEQALKQIKESVANEYEMKLKDKDFQFNKMREQIEEMKRKAEQGSVQLQGEVQEIALEEMLRNFFPYDLIQEVPKGVKGADSIQIVRNFSGRECGKIIYESKRTKNFEPKWIDKLKHDMRDLGASVAVLVTEAMPSDMDKFGSKDGIWICSYAEVKSLSFVLRDSLLKIQTVLDSQENREDKLGLLYNYITGDEFRNRLEAVAEGFRNVKETINKERIFMEKMWAEREKQMEKAMSSTVKVFGSVRGIVGTGMGDLKMLEE
ncbi:MAG TPA: DUF2130 domain-containing protein [Cytophagales bacterium]|nr:DUF2130 domain-containing protein [Cytophagales bacterium]